MFVLFLTGDAHCSYLCCFPGKLQPVVNVDWKSDQESFTVTCNARRVTFPPAEFSAVVWKLQIAVMLGSSQSYRKVAEYLVCGPSDKLQFQVSDR